MSHEFLLLAMVFCHIVDDYYLQGWLASAKQRKWWEHNAPQKLYENDYIVALLMHSVSWSFMIMLPIAIVMHFQVGNMYVVIFLSNMVIHGLTDDAKANLLKINLMTDQLIHMAQIAITYLIFSAVLF